MAPDCARRFAKALDRGESLGISFSLSTITLKAAAMLTPDQLAAGRKLKTTQEIGLWDEGKYAQRTGWQWPGQSPPAGVPPLTEGGELIGGKYLPVGTIVVVQAILYHDGKGYQCIRASVELAEWAGQTGFLYTMHGDTDQVELLHEEDKNGQEQDQPPDDEQEQPQPGVVQVEIRPGYLTTGDVVIETGAVTTGTFSIVPNPPAPPVLGVPSSGTLIRITTTERLLETPTYQPAAEASVFVVRKDGKLESLGQTNSSGQLDVALPDGAILHIETRNGYSLSVGAPRSSYNAQLGLPSDCYDYASIGSIANIAAAELKPGVDQNNQVIAVPPNLMDILAGSGGAVSLGKDGILLLRFRPPLIHLPGQAILTVSEVAAGEPYDIEFGNFDEVEVFQAAIKRQAPASRPGGGVDYVLDASIPARTSFEGVRIIDTTPQVADLAGQPVNQPGLDITRIVGRTSSPSRCFCIMLDISGSMADNDQGEFYRKYDGKPPAASLAASWENRLYHKATLAILDNLVTSATEPGGRADDTEYQLVTFYGKGSEKRIEVQADPTRSKSEFRAQLAELQTKEFYQTGFNHFTPLASAIVEGIKRLDGRTQTSCRTLIVITDGDGTNDNEVDERFGSLSKPDALEGIDINRAGVIELIGYKIYPPETRWDFHAFSLASWLMAPHEVGSAAQLGELMAKLKAKYRLA